jgi:hypothetical protein
MYTPGDNSSTQDQWNQFTSGSYFNKMQSALFPTPPTMAPSATTPGQNTLAQAQQMIDPAQQRLQSTFGQNPVFGSSAFGQTVPGKVIGNLALAMSQAQPGHTFADSARIVGNMVRAPQEYQLAQERGAAQAQISGATQQGALADTLAQIQDRNSQSNYYQQEGAWRRSQEAYNLFRTENPIAKPEQTLIDDNGTPWQQLVVSGEPKMVNAISGKPPDPNNPPTFSNNPHGTFNWHQGANEDENFTPGRIISDMTSNNPERIKRGNAAFGLAARMSGAQSSARAAGENDTKLDDAQAEALKNAVVQGEYKGLQKAEEQDVWALKDPIAGAKDFEQHGAVYAAYKKGIEDSNQKIQNRVQSYIASGAYRKNQTMDDYVKSQSSESNTPPPSLSTSSNTPKQPWMPH